MAGAAAACDIEGTQHEQDAVGPALRVVGSNVGGPNASIDPGGAIQLVFDRYLLPGTYKRQAFTIFEAGGEPLNTQALQSIYDPVALTVTITGPGGYGVPWLIPGQSYRLVLHVADDARDAVEDLSGFRAIDRAPLAERREFIFRAKAKGETDAGLDAGAEAGAGDAGAAGPVEATPRRIDPVVDFCADVMPIFEAKCTNAICHSAKGAAAGLILESADGIRQTAIDRVAHGASTARQGDTAESANRLFGINMPLITRGDPGSSWLLYKVELAAPTVIDAGPAPSISCSPPVGSPPIPPRSTQLFAPIVKAEEIDDKTVEQMFMERDRSVLSDSVLGREMPYPYPPGAYVEPDAYKYTPLTFQERERIRIWIADNAEMRDCGGCGVIED